ncbi:hypothetical protein CDL15_Pgr025567 [Punica granatum]|uniref:Uncharacterized protein n=1 Tax=Punica granatum TaxID=22663 RepID=A0A218WB88_PUNGR|nr:hypothetical protein CDL15_Pgr025567 [Punica granatum]
MDHFHQTISSDSNDFELEESDVIWGCNEKPAGNISSPPSTTRGVVMIPPAMMSNASSKKKEVTSASLPVSVPDWSGIRRLGECDDWIEEEEEEEDDGLTTGMAKLKLPPHEYLAMRRGDPSSVHEGIGRTLKGRELCRVRNEILKKLVGFED